MVSGNNGKSRREENPRLTSSVNSCLCNTAVTLSNLPSCNMLEIPTISLKARSMKATFRAGSLPGLQGPASFANSSHPEFSARSVLELRPGGRRRASIASIASVCTMVCLPFCARLGEAENNKDKDKKTCLSVYM